MMHPDNNGQLRLFMTCARRLNFRRAAEELQLKPATVSERIRALETSIGVRLFNRTTRSVSLTQAGKDLMTRIGPALDQIDEAITAAREVSPVLAGRIRINGPRPALEYRLAPLLIRFMAEHPNVEIELIGDDGLVDVVGDGFDAGVRFAEKLHKDSIAISLGAPHRFQVVASPEYLSRNGTPKRPRDLNDHNCLAQMFPSGNRLAWEFERDGKCETIVAQGSLVTSEPSAQLLAAEAGLGIAYLFEEHCDRLVREGRLVPLLQAWLQPFAAAYLYYSERRLMQPALRALVDHIKAHARGPQR